MYAAKNHCGQHPVCFPARRIGWRQPVILSKKRKGGGSMQEKRGQTAKSEHERAQGKKKEEKIRTDVLGSYTGIPQDGGKPEQDADDL